MIRITLSAIGLATVIGLTGCNETTGGLSPDPSAPTSTVALALPQGAVCSKEIDRYESVVRADLATGNVEQSVYDQIQSEMTRAAHACSAGNGGESHAIVAASKAKHGYRA